MRRAAFSRLATSLAAAAAGLALVGGGLAQMPAAHADVYWCFDDPIVSVHGHLIDIHTAQPLADLLTMRSTNLVVVIPSNVSGSVVLNDISAFPMQTRVSATGPAWSGKGAIPITVKGTVTASKSYGVEIVALPVLNLGSLLSGTTTAQGTTNTTIVMPMSVAN